jgi:hypothetical protein
MRPPDPRARVRAGGAGLCAPEGRRARGAQTLLAALLAVAASALPAVRFDHPTQDFEFAPEAAGARADVVLVVQALADPAWRAFGYAERLAQWEGGRWDLAIDINAHEVGRWRATELINALGEVSAHVTVPAMPAGEHVASCRLEPRDVAPSGLEPPEHTISFFVRDSPRPPPAPPDAWTPPLCSRCAQAFSCSSTNRVGDMGDSTRDGAGAVLQYDVCSGHGVCQNGACLCAAGWTGEVCDHDISRHAAFLPDVDPARALSRCAKSIAWELDGSSLDQLFEELLPSDASQCEARAHAHGAACRPGATCAETHDDPEGRKQGGGMLLFGPPTHGLGFNVHYVSHMVAWAAERRQVPALVETPALGAWPYGHIPACPPRRQGWSCLFEPLSACDSFAQLAVDAAGVEEGLGQSGVREDQGLFAPPHVPPAHLSQDTRRYGEVGLEGQGASSSSSSRRPAVHSRADGIPKVGLEPPASVRGQVLGVPTHGALWWRAHLVSRIMRPSPFIRSILRRCACSRTSAAGAPVCDDEVEVTVTWGALEVKVRKEFDECLDSRLSCSWCLARHARGVFSSYSVCLARVAAGCAMGSV